MGETDVRLVSGGGAKPGRGCADSEQRQPKRGRGTTEEQPWHIRNGYKMTVSKF